MAKKTKLQSQLKNRHDQLQKKLRNDSKQVNIRKKIDDLLTEKQYRMRELALDESTPSVSKPVEIKTFNSADEKLLVADTEIADHDPFWVLEPEDLNDLSLDEVRHIWQNKERLCGSIEAAAEALALLRVENGKDTFYRGWQTVIGSEELSTLRNELPSLFALDQINTEVTPQDKDSSTTRCNALHRYSRAEVINLEQNILQKAWENRLSSFQTISAACEALALIRYGSGIDAIKQPWSSFSNSEAIEPLFDFMEDDSELISGANALMRQESVTALDIDQRHKEHRHVVIRWGQKEFREAVFSRYMGKCCLTGYSESSVLEAAHIMPYMGDQSNLIDNGLLLRVDIHRLFDKFLISINPETLRVVISASLTTCYKELSYVKLPLTTTNLTRKLLQRHYDTFKETESYTVQ